MPPVSLMRQLEDYERERRTFTWTCLVRRDHAAVPSDAMRYSAGRMYEDFACRVQYRDRGLALRLSLAQPAGTSRGTARRSSRCVVTLLFEFRSTGDTRDRDAIEARNLARVNWSAVLVSIHARARERANHSRPGRPAHYQFQSTISRAAQGRRIILARGDHVYARRRQCTRRIRRTCAASHRSRRRSVTWACLTRAW